MAFDTITDFKTADANIRDTAPVAALAGGVNTFAIYAQNAMRALAASATRTDALNAGKGADKISTADLRSERVPDGGLHMSLGFIIEATPMPEPLVQGRDINPEQIPSA